VLSNSIQQFLLVITNGRHEVHARTLTLMCKGPIQYTSGFRCNSIPAFSVAPLQPTRLNGFLRKKIRQKTSFWLGSAFWGTNDYI